MSRLNVEYKGKWSNFCTIVDAFVIPFVDKDVYGEWHMQTYQTTKTFGSVNFDVSTITMEDAVLSVSLNRTRKETIDSLLEITGLEEDEIIALVDQYGSPRELDT